MTRTLYTTWTEYQGAVDAVLASAERHLCIYDADLSVLRLDDASRLVHLRRLVQAGHPNALRIAVRDGTHVRNHAPHLLELLATYGHVMNLVETPEHLAHLRDSMMIADTKTGVIRFEQNQARCKLVDNDIDELAPYKNRFDELWQEGNHPISPSTLGL